MSMREILNIWLRLTFNLVLDASTEKNGEYKNNF